MSEKSETAYGNNSATVANSATIPTNSLSIDTLKLMIDPVEIPCREGVLSFSDSTGTVTVKRSNGRFYVNIDSVPQCFMGDKGAYKPISVDETRKLLLKIGHEIGVLEEPSDILSLPITVIHLFKNVSLDHPYYVYSSLLQDRKGRWMHTKRWDDTIQFGSSSKGVSFYNKNQQLIEKHDCEIDDEIMRVEMKLSRCRNVQSVLGFRTIGEVLDNWKLVEQRYCRFLEDRLFSKVVPDDEVQASMKKKFESEAEFRKWCVWTLSEMIFGSRKAALSICGSMFEWDRSTIYRRRKECGEMQKHDEWLRKIPSQELLLELEKKLCGMC